MTVCMINLIGLPASGKTTLSNLLQQEFASWNVFNICYDYHIKWEENKTIDYKAQRKEIVENIEKLVASIKNENFSNIPYQFVHQPGIKFRSDTRTLIILDDNNFYRSMRYKIFQISAKYEISFGQIYLPIDAKKAIELNKARDNPIPSSVIEKMNCRLEAPNLYDYWEKNTFISSSSIQVERIKDFIDSCYETIAIINIPHKKESIQQSMLHQIDILLRKEISSIIRNLYPKFKDVSIIANELTKKRKRLLEDIKTGVCYVDPNNIHVVIQYFSLK